MKWKSLHDLDLPEVRALSYPNMDPRYSTQVLDELNSLGVEEIAFTDDGRPYFLGKGFRNVVLLVRVEEKPLAAKVRRDDWPHKEVWREVSVHKAANSLGIGPKLHGFARVVITMEVIEGARLPEWVGEASRDELISVMRSLMYQCRALDAACIDHGELGDPSKHVIVSKGGTVVIIDFGSARYSQRPKNFTSIASFLSRSGVKEAMQCAGLNPVVDVALLRRYKRTLSEEEFRAVLVSIGLE